MPAEALILLEQHVALMAMVSVLVLVWLAMQELKAYARWVLELSVLVEKQKRKDKLLEDV